MIVIYVTISAALMLIETFDYYVYQNKCSCQHLVKSFWKFSLNSTTRSIVLGQHVMLRWKSAYQIAFLIMQT